MGFATRLKKIIIIAIVQLNAITLDKQSDTEVPELLPAGLLGGGGCAPSAPLSPYYLHIYLPVDFIHFIQRHLAAWQTGGRGHSGGWKPRRERWGDAHTAVPPQRCGGSGCGRPVGAGAGGAPRGPEPPARCSVPPLPPPTAPRVRSQPLGAAPGCPRPRAAAQPERAPRRTRPLKTAKENFSRVQIRN